MKKTMLAGAAMVAGAFLIHGTIPPAHADALTFIQGLNDAGMIVYDTSQALSVGTAICNALDTTNGETVAQNWFRISLRTEVPTITVAREWVIIAVQELCPWQDHTGQATQTDFGPYRA